jgi:polyhydroxyalkanoate synthase subunit PhaC
MSKHRNGPAHSFVHFIEDGQELMRRFIVDSGNALAPGNDPAATLFAASKYFARQQQKYLEQSANFWLSALGVPRRDEGEEPAAADDRRFATDAWRSDPRFETIKRVYLAYATFLQELASNAPLDKQAKSQLSFAVRQFADAISPSNFLASNPDAIETAVETGGQSLVEGMNLFFRDLACGRISMTDETAFEVGRNLAVTEGAVVFENELIQLIQYAPRTGKVHERPLLIVPPCINKYYILDLQPENSFVRHVLDEGHTVFLISWRSATREIDRLTWDDYLQRGVMRALDAALDVSGADKVNALGFCVGGTLLGSALAVQAANGIDKVASVTLLTTMLDFSDTGDIGTLVTEESVAAREAALGHRGLLQGKELGLVFSSLRANDLIWPYVVNNYLKGKTPPAFDLLYWNADGTNLPGPMFCWYLRNTYLENNLAVPGKTVQCGTPVDLSRITVPAYVYASRDDHIVPWRTAYASRSLLGGETTFVLGASGHIAGVINPPSKKRRNYWSDGVAGKSADAWIASAQSIPGSWWPHWSEWLAGHAGPKVEARTTLGNAEYPVVEPSPGRYVKAIAD